LWIDTSPQAREEGRNIAGILGSYYLPLPYAGAQELSQAVIQAIKN
jgi:magnesium chelatase subunit D